jgi:hypothetical protein
LKSSGTGLALQPVQRGAAVGDAKNIDSESVELQRVSLHQSWLDGRGA